MKNDYYEKTGKLNPQIAVMKNNKSIIEALDRLKFEDSSAQVESSYSRIRIGIQDFSQQNNKPKYAWANITPEQARIAYDALNNLGNVGSTEELERYQNDVGSIMGMLLQHQGQLNPNELGYVDNLLRQNWERLEEAKKPTSIFEEKKILPYQNYANPNNSGEHLITGLRITYNKEMRIPVIFEVSQGYGVAQRDNTGRVKYSGEHDTMTLKKFLTVSEAKSFLGKVVRFCDAMAGLATRKYYELKLSGLAETVTNEEGQNTQEGFIPYEPNVQDNVPQEYAPQGYAPQEYPAQTEPNTGSYIPYQNGGYQQTPLPSQNTNASHFAGTAFEGFDTLYG